MAVSDIIKLEADGADTTFYIKGNISLRVSKNLKESKTFLADNGFYRALYSCLVDLNEVERYVKSGDEYIIKKDGSQTNILNNEKEKFIELMSLRYIDCISQALFVNPYHFFVNWQALSVKGNRYPAK